MKRFLIDVHTTEVREVEAVEVEKICQCGCKLWAVGIREVYPEITEEEMKKLTYIDGYPDKALLCHENFTNDPRQFSNLKLILFTGSIPGLEIRARHAVGASLTPGTELEIEVAPIDLSSAYMLEMLGFFKPVKGKKNSWTTKVPNTVRDTRRQMQEIH